MKNLLIALATLSLPLTSMAQHLQCGTDQQRQALIAADPTYLQREAEYAEEIRDLIANSAARGERDVILTIPIVFHIIHLGGDENISNEQIFNQVDLLNQDFSRTNPDISQVYEAFSDIIGDAEIRFELPTKDPEGNCTNGILRVYSPETLVGDDGSKIGAWPRRHYLNVWTVQRMRDGVAGYAYYPGALDGPIGQLADGVILLNNYVGDIGTSNLNSSTALTHEIGHVLNLPHVWGNNNGPDEEGPQPPAGHMSSECGDDGVSDTPQTRGWNGCPSNPKDWADCNRQPFDPLIQNFDGVNSGSGTTAPNTIEVRDTLGNRLRAVLTAPVAVGVSDNSSLDDKFAFSSWPLGALDGDTAVDLTGIRDENKYYEFTVDPTVSDVANIAAIAFIVNRNETGARTFSMRTSANNYGSAITPSLVGPQLTIVSGAISYRYDVVGDQEVAFTLPSSTFTNLLDPVTFRIYAWSAEDTDGTFVVDDLQIRGQSVRIENVQNYMEYSYCSNMFSAGQVSRMRAAMNSSTGDRSSLWTESNLQFTGIAEGFRSQCGPLADFFPRISNSGGSFSGSSQEPRTPMVCTGVDVKFIDNSSRSIPTSWSWSFQDGSPSTSNDQNPIVQFSSPGWKSVTLTASNDQGSDTRTNEFSILVGGGPNDVFGLYQEGFEDENGLAPFVQYNYDDNITTWARTATTSYSGNACAKLNSGDRNPVDLINSSNANDYDDLVSPTYDLSLMVNADMSFRYAYNTSTTMLEEVTESLIVSISTDCGKTWNALDVIDDGDIINNGVDPSFPPPDWAFRSYTLNQSQRAHDVRFRFRFFSSAFSGDLFIDDININGVVGIEGLTRENFMTLYPNPTNDRFTLGVFGMDNAKTTIVVQDMRGAVVYSTTRNANGGASMEFNTKELGLADGMYLVRASNESGSSTQKLMVGK
jgi:PKD repeat protein